MIPRPGPRVEQLPPLKLYREDLDKLLSLFLEHCQNVTFGDEGHNYETLDEMEGQSPASLSCFIVQGLLPHAEIVIRGSHATRLNVQRSTLFVVERNPKSDLLFLSVKDFLLNRKSKLRIFFRQAAIIAGVIGIAACVFTKALSHSHGTSELGYDLAFLGSFGLLLLGLLVNTKQVSYITLRLRSKSQSFWERNGDSIGMMVIGVVVGALGTLMTEWLKHFLSK
ncbi:MAG TPA: hypothetical protein VNY51_03755 [Candidatus Dormibacteraeota bacterium]|jgi:hypothetical protein|nr:hypothetical protein [Candidatus Dormibacteraeota bacterium]